MSVEQDMVECPVCGRRIPADSSKCPGCGEDLSMSSFEELEQVAQNLSAEPKDAIPDPPVAPKADEPRTADPPRPEEPKEEAPNGDTENGEKKGRFHLFGRKKH
jgi:hypothetical protein